MNYQMLSIQSLYALHHGIHRAVATDDNRPRHLRVYGVRVFRDWTVQSRTIEQEMRARGLPYATTGL